MRLYFGLLFLLPLTAHAGGFESAVIFQNAAITGPSYHSTGSVVAPSELELEANKLPARAERFTSPPNSLRLAWTSAFGGDWRATIKVASQYGHRFRFSGDTLVLNCYSEEGLLLDEAPRLYLRSAKGGSPTVSLLLKQRELPAKKWTQVELPLEGVQGIFGGTADSEFDLASLEAVELVQGLDDGQPHLLWIDDVRLLTAEQLRDREAPAAPQGLAATGRDRHVDLAWRPNAESDLLGYRVYRAENSAEYLPISSRPAFYQRAVNFVGDKSPELSYCITAVDVTGNESAPSNVAAARTRPHSDDELLSMVQEGCFRYYWEANNKPSGMALEILPGDEQLVALGASGFGIGALVVGAERGFAPREQIAERLLKILRFLERADRFHGVWPHFLHGETGRVTALFGKYDNGSDLVETAFLMQGLLIARQYFDRDNPAEQKIRARITKFWREVEWDWHRRDPESPVLYWHWSPEHAWKISHPLIGWNETMIIYLLAIASPTHGVPAEMFHTGFAGTDERAINYRRNWSRTTAGDHYVNGRTFAGHKIDVGCGNGGELFFNQFSFHGFDPRGKRDRYTNYARNNRNIALVSRAYAIENPRKRTGYGPDCWGFSAGVNNGGGRPLPRDDNGTICSSAAIGVFPFTPDESLAALKHFYRELGPKVWGVYGFHDGFNETEQWFDEVYMGLNQAQIVVMIENQRTGLPWKCFMANPEMAPMLEAIGFVADEEGDR
jgi:exo beta-1,2-glucooligosaccharide sophorohydrolase (non-reducing end)